jgi:hypothetical protein
MFSSALYEGAQARGTTARKRAFRLTRLFGVEVKMLSPANLRAQIFPLADKAQFCELWDHQIPKKSPAAPSSRNSSSGAAYFFRKPHRTPWRAHAADFLQLLFSGEDSSLSGEFRGPVHETPGTTHK